MNLTPVNDLPVVSGDPVTVAYEDALYSYPLDINDSENGPFNLVESVSLPSWLRLEVYKYVGDRSSNVIYYDFESGKYDFIRWSRTDLEPENRYFDQVTLADGTRYYADAVFHVIRKVSGGTETIFAGGMDRNGSVDGNGTAARFYGPSGIAVDSDGNFFVTEYGNHVIRKITPSGEVSLYAGAFNQPGTANGSLTQARFNQPYGIAIDGNDTLYVSEAGSHTIRKITAGGQVSLYAGTPGASGSANGTALSASFNKPAGIALDDNGTLYVADKLNHVIRKIGTDGRVTDYYGVSGQMDDPANPTMEKLAFPFDVTFGEARQGPHQMGVNSPPNRCVMLDGDKTGCRDETSVEVYRPVTLRTDIWADQLPASAPFQLNTSSLSVLMPGLGTAYPNGDEVYIDFNVSHSTLAYNEHLDYNIEFKADFYVRTAGTQGDRNRDNFAFAVTVTGTVAMVASVDRESTMENGYGPMIGFERSTEGNMIINSLNFSNLQASASTIGNVNAFLLGFKLNLASTGIVTAMNSDENFRWRLGNDHLLKQDETVKRSDGEKLLFVQDNSQFNVRRLVPAYRLTGTPENDDVGVHDVNLSIDDLNGTAVAYDFQVTVANVNDAPSASDLAFTIDEDETKTFAAGDFNVTDVDAGDSLEAVYVTSLPAAGSLKLSGTAVALNQRIAAADLASLVFAPDPDASGSPYASFGFRVNDGEANSTSAYTGTFRVASVEDAPLITSTPASSVTRGSPYVYTPSATDGDEDFITWSVSDATPLPSWLRWEERRTGARSTNVFYYDYNWSDYRVQIDPTTEPRNRYYDEVTLADGSRYYADALSHVIRKGRTGDANETIFAGLPEMNGSVDGNGTGARFNEPSGIAVDSAGNFFVTEYGSHVIRKITPAGEVSLYAGAFDQPGTANGTRTDARFNKPYGIAIDGNDTIYVSEEGSHTIRKITAAGEVSLYAGTPGVSGSANGTALEAAFNKPAGIALDDDGSLYVADKFNHVIRKIGTDGNVTDYYGVSGQMDDPSNPTFDKLAYPFDVTFAPAARGTVGVNDWNECVHLDSGADCRDAGVVENYYPQTKTLRMRADEVPSDFPFQLNATSLDLLFPGMKLIYGANKECYMEINVTVERFAYENDVSQTLVYQAAFYVRMAGTEGDRDPDNFSRAVTAEGTIDLQSGLNPWNETLGAGYGEPLGFQRLLGDPDGNGTRGMGVATLRFEDMRILESRIGTINTSSALFKLNLTASAFISALNGSGRTWELGNDYLLRQDESLDASSARKLLFVQDNSQYNVRRIEPRYRLVGIPGSGEGGVYPVTLVAGDGSRNVEQTFHIKVTAPATGGSTGGDSGVGGFVPNPPAPEEDPNVIGVVDPEEGDEEPVVIDEVETGTGIEAPEEVAVGEDGSQSINVPLSGGGSTTLKFAPGSGTVNTTTTTEGYEASATLTTQAGSRVTTSAKLNNNGTLQAEVSVSHGGATRKGTINALKTGVSLETGEDGSVRTQYTEGTVTVKADVTETGNVAHEVEVTDTGGNTVATKASSKVSGSSVTILADGTVQTKARLEEGDGTILDAVVDGEIDGRATHLLKITDSQGNSVTTRATSEVPGAQTVIEEDGGVETTVENVSVKAQPDGTAVHTVNVTDGNGNSATSRVTSRIPGAGTVIGAGNLVETTVERTVNADGTTYTVRAVAQTDGNGETATRSVWIDPVTGQQVREERTSDRTTPFEADSQVEIVERDDTVFIDTTAPVTRTIIIE